MFCVSILFVDDDDDGDGDRWVFSHDLHSHSFPLAFSKISAPVQQCLNQQSRQHTVYNIPAMSLTKLLQAGELNGTKLSSGP